MLPGNTTVDLARLRAKAEELGTTPYLVSVTEGQTPHCSVVEPDWDSESGRLIVSAPSKWEQSRRAGHLGVTLLWPPSLPGGYSLIVDGTVAPQSAGSDPRLAVTPTRAVLHRPQRSGIAGSACGADCIEITNQPPP